MMALDGIRVLEVASMVAGPFGAALLGDMGADVIKVEPPGGDQARHIGPRSGTDSGVFVGVNRNKRSICADLRQAGGRGVLEKLVQQADVIIENVHGPAKTRLGLDFGSLKEQNSKIVSISVSTYGSQGPYAGRPGIDPVAQAFSGFMYVTGEADGRPLKAGPPVGDATASLLVAYGAMLGLWVRDRTGDGQGVDVALVDGLLHIQAPFLGQYFLLGRQQPRMGNSLDWYSPYNSFVCADGKPIQVAAFNDKFFANLCNGIGQPELALDSRFVTNERRLENRGILEEILAEHFQVTTRSEACRHLAECDALFAPINSYEETFADAQIQAAGMVQNVSHMNLGELQVTGVPLKMSETEGSVRQAPPALGEHTEEVLRELSFDESEVRHLFSSGSVMTGISD